VDIPEILSINSEEVIANLYQESIDAYIFLKDQFEVTKDIRENYFFHFVYRSFYRLDNAGLSNNMKVEYFNLMQELRNNTPFDFSVVCDRLYKIPNLKGQNSLQFSFATKMANMINETCPIYDSEVASMFGFRAPYNYKTYDQRLKEYTLFYNDMAKQYIDISQNDLLLSVFENMNSKLNNIESLSAIKKLDFLMWSAGKLKNKQLLKVA